jgi:hypothetical protein
MSSSVRPRLVKKAAAWSIVLSGLGRFTVPGEVPSERPVSASYKAPPSCTRKQKIFSQYQYLTLGDQGDHRHLIFPDLVKSEF